MLRLFKYRHSKVWHKKIQAIPVNSEEGPEDPYVWLELRSCTDEYLRNKGKLSVEETDTQLQLLIQEHPNTIIAIAACAHRFSTQGLRRLLKAELSTIANGRVSVAALKAVAIVKAVHPAAISYDEELWAQRLTPLATLDLEVVSETWLPLLLSSVSSSDMLFSGPIRGLACFLCRKLANELSYLKLRNEWSTAYLKANHLALAYEGVQGTEKEAQAVQALNQAFPTWQSWVLWKPDFDRLQSWEVFTEEETIGLKPLMALEGPSFSTSKHATLKEGLIEEVWTLSSAIVPQPNESPRILCFEGIVIRLESGDAGEAKSFLDHLCRLLDSIRVSSRAMVGIFIRTIWKEINSQSLRIIDHLIQTPDSKATEAVRSLYVMVDSRSLGTDLPQCTELLATILDALQFDERRELREDLTPMVLEFAGSCLVQKQALFRQELQGQEVSKSARDLHSFGHLLRKSGWLTALFTKNTQQLLSSWPTWSDVNVLQALRLEAGILELKGLQSHIANVSLSLMVDATADSEELRILIMELKQCWLIDNDRARRHLALTVATFPVEDDETCLRISCIKNLHLLPSHYYSVLAKILRPFLQSDNRARAESCVLFTRLLAQQPPVIEGQHWAALLRLLLEWQTTVVDKLLKWLTVDEYFQLMGNIRVIFAEEFNTKQTSASSTGSLLFDPYTHDWCQTISPYAELLHRLVSLGEDVAICLLSGGSSMVYHLWLEKLLNALDTLGAVEDTASRRELMLSFIGRLDRDGGNSPEISPIVVGIRAVSPAGLEAISKFLERHTQKAPKPLLEAFLMGWLSDPALDTLNDRPTLQKVATLLNYSIEVVHVTTGAYTDCPALNAAKQYIEDELEALIAEANRLNGLRLGLKAADSTRTTAMLDSVGFAEPSTIEDAIALLPNDLLDVIEQVGDYEVEMHFSLSGMKSLTKTAMGIDSAQSFSVRFSFPYLGLPAGYCVHVNDDLSSHCTKRDVMHSYWYMVEAARSPELNYCCGKSSRLIYQMQRSVFRYLQKEGFTTIEALYTTIVDAVKDITCSCMVCGIGLGVRLKRSTICTAAACLQTYARAEPDIRLAYLRTDALASDLLLSAVYAAAVSVNSAILLPLLTASPMSSTELSKYIGHLPSTAGIQNTPSTQVLYNLLLIHRIPKDIVNKLLPWVDESFGGYLIAATGQYKIPSCPNMTQFLLCSAHPSVETAFARHPIPAGGSKVLFHGTSLERLLPILRHGLKVQSGSNLQVHGAARGAGIYLAEEPSTSTGYALTTVVNWSGSQFKKVKIILGCEYVGNVASVSGIVVVTDPTTVMVRYVFVMSEQALAPHARHIVPAMLGAFSTLRAY